MVDYEQHRVLHRLDDPLRIFYWTLDEAIILILSPFIGTALDHPFMGLGVSLLGTYALCKLKKRLGGGTLRHAFYWYFPHNPKLFRVTPPSHIREYVG